METLQKMNGWISEKMSSCTDEEKQLIKRLALKNFIDYCKNEQSHLLINYASTDFLDFRVYPSEIVRQIDHNIKNAKNVKNELINQRRMEKIVTKAKNEASVGFASLLRKVCLAF